MDRSIARRLLAAGLALGLLAELVLDGPAFGLNVADPRRRLLGAGWLVRRRGRAPDPLDAWLPVVAIVLAGFVAVRGDPFLALLDTRRSRSPSRAPRWRRSPGCRSRDGPRRSSRRWRAGSLGRAAGGRTRASRRPPARHRPRRAPSTAASRPAVAPSAAACSSGSRWR